MGFLPEGVDANESLEVGGVETIPEPRQQSSGEAPRLSVLESLPDDLLQDILELTYDSFAIQPSRQRSFVIRASHISNRLRTVTLSTARLWSHIASDHFHDAGVAAFLERSQSAGLSITIRPAYATGDWTQSSFLKQIAKHIRRWKKFSGEFAKLEELAVLQALGPLNLPNLRYFRCMNGCPAEGLPGQIFFSNWSMPSLIAFSGTNIAPFSLSMPYLSSFEIGNTDVYPFIPPLSFSTVNEFFPRLTRLTLSAPSFDSSFKYEPVLFQALQALKFEMSYNADANYSSNAWSFFQRLEAPELGVLHMAISTEHRDLVSMQVLSERLETFPKLRSLTLKAPGQCTIELELLLSKTPLLEQLSLIYTKIGQSVTQTYPKTLPPLQRICIQGCTLTERAVQDLVDALVRSPCWNAFEKLEIKNCCGISTSFSRALTALAPERILASRPTTAPGLFVRRRVETI